jgi:hypothetical protein
MSTHKMIYIFCTLEFPKIKYKLIIAAKLLVLFFSLILKVNNTQAQAPQGISYQAVARNAQGQPLANDSIAVKFSIIDSIASGTSVYVETHNTTTNSLGIFSLNVGTGIANTGTFNNINWGVNAKFLKVELDTSGTGNSYLVLGTQKMMSVPYALFSGKAEQISGVGNNLSHYSVYSNPGTYSWPVPSGVTFIIAEVWGAGGGGYASSGGSSGGAGSGGGGGGGYAKEFFSVTPGATISLVVGAGGIGGSCSYFGSSNGTSGGFSQILSTIAGGGGGGYWDNGTQGGIGGTGISSYLKFQGSKGSFPNGGSGGFGGGIGATGYSNNGQSPGGGGSGNAPGCSAKAGDGASGKIIIWW